MPLAELLEKIRKIQEPKKEDRLDLLLSDKTRETQSVYNSQIRKFLSWRKKISYDKWDILGFLNHLKKQRFSSSYIRGTYYALKLLFESRGWPWEAKLPKLKDTRVIKPAMPKEDIIKMILTTNTRGTAEEKTYLALSTTYGLRRAEMANLTPEDLDFEKKTIFIRTKKGGTPRSHLLPLPILNLLQQYDLGRAPSLSYLSLLFKRICRLANIEIEKGINWHTIRHRLLIELVDAGFGEIPTKKFLRWRYGESMPSYYYTKDQKEIDFEIFSKHPFLIYLENQEEV